MVTVVVCGGSTVSLLTWFDIPIGVEEDEDETKGPSSPLSASATPNHTYNSMQSGSEAVTVPPGNIPADKSIAAKAWSGFDAKYMKPLLTHSNPTLMETLHPCFGTKIGRFLTSKEQLARHPRMMNNGTNGTGSSEEESPEIFNRDDVINVDQDNETITIERNKNDNAIDAIPQLPA